MADLDYIIKFASDTLGLDKANSAIGKVGAALAALGVGFAAFKVVGFLSDATKGAADFEQQLATVQAVSSATTEQMGRIKEASEELGKSTRYNATQAAEGFEILARAGLSVEDSLATIPSVLALAQGNALGLGEAAGFVTKAVQGMGLEFSESGRVADVLAKAAASANTDVSGLGSALSYAAPSAAALGLSLEDTTAFLGVFADAGIDASRAGTALNGMLSQFGNSGSSFKRELVAAGITTNDFGEAIRQLAEKGKGGEKAINALGLEAGPALKALIGQGVPALDELRDKLLEAGGTAAEQAEVMNNTWQGALAGLDSNWQSLKDKLGESFLTPMAGSFKELGAAITELVDSGKIKQLGDSAATAFKEASAAAIDFVTSIDMADVIDKVNNSLAALSTVMVGANGAFQALSIFVNGLKNGILAIGIALSMVLTIGVEVHKFFIDTGRAIANFFGLTSTAVDGYSESLGGALKASEDFRAFADEEMAATSKSMGESLDSIAGKSGETGEAIVSLKGQVKDTFTDIVDSANQGSKDTSKSLQEIRDNTNEMITGFGDAEQFSALLESIVDTGQEATVGSEIMNRLIIGAGDLAGAHTVVVEKAKESMKELGMTAEGVAEKTRQAIEGTFSALNIDVQQNLSGINSKTQETFNLIASGANEVANSTYSATEKAALLASLLEKGLGAAKTKEEFKEFNEVMKANGLASLLTAEQNKILQAGMQGGADAAAIASDAIDKQTASLDTNAISTNENTSNIKENTAARKEQSTTTWNASFATDKATQSESASLAVMQQMTAEIKGKIAVLEKMGATTEQVDGAWRKLTNSMDGQKFLGVQDFANSLQRVDDIVTKQVSSFEQAKNRANEMTQALSGSAVSSRDLADAQQALRKATDANVQGLIRMDGQTLDNLKNAIDGARQKMQGLSNDAKNTADALEATLAKMQGKEDKAREIEQTKKLTELELKLNEAKASGNSEQAAQLKRALDLQKQINIEEDKKARADAAASNTAPIKNTQPSGSRSKDGGTNSTRTVDINLKLNGSNTKLTIPESQENAMMAFMRQLEESKALSGQ